MLCRFFKFSIFSLLLILLSTLYFSTIAGKDYTTYIICIIQFIELEFKRGCSCCQTCSDTIFIHSVKLETSWPFLDCSEFRRGKKQTLAFEIFCLVSLRAQL